MRKINKRLAVAATTIRQLTVANVDAVRGGAQHLQNTLAVCKPSIECPTSDGSGPK